MLGLQPVEEAEAHSLCILEGARGIGRRAIKDAAVAIVVAGPVEHRQVLLFHQTSVRPQAAFRAGQLLVQAVLQPAALLAVDLAAVHFDAQAVGLRVAVMLVFLWLPNQVTFAGRTPLANEGVGETLYAVGLRLMRLRLRFAGLRDRFRAGDVLGSGKRQQITELGRIDDNLRPKADDPAFVQRERLKRRDAIAIGPHGQRLGTTMDGESAGLDLGREHALDHLERDAGLEGEPRYPAVTGVRFAVVRADRVAQRVVARRAAARLDVLMLVERGDALRGELPAEPVGLLEQHDAAATARGGERGGDTACAAAGDQDVAGFS